MLLKDYTDEELRDELRRRAQERRNVEIEAYKRGFLEALQLSEILK